MNPSAGDHYRKSDVSKALPSALDGDAGADCDTDTDGDVDAEGDPELLEFQEHFHSVMGPSPPLQRLPPSLPLTLQLLFGGWDFAIYQIAYMDLEGIGSNRQLDAAILETYTSRWAGKACQRVPGKIILNLFAIRMALMAAIVYVDQIYMFTV
ncbi:hypothetical protein BD779DRAFT_1471483 [Infundibulicybe gibba]|nr:hypothetical protein BD779DRAFT_1471483 [Infundibulicybe gibba]